TSSRSGCASCGCCAGFEQRARGESCTMATSSFPPIHIAATRPFDVSAFAPTATTARGDVERACEFVLAGVTKQAGTRAYRGRRKTPLGCLSSSPWVRIFAEQRLCRLSTAVARALVAWADGFPVILLERVPSAAEVLYWQATGRRCVSLLAEDRSEGAN